ncbi:MULTISPECIES: bifunctional nuclease family protein [unclassified Cryobacterium]|uniref:bifunctional nuclease family protein n=1 Tax=unclassified Cryobacterium TaxID=2649013 RepID=UPI001068DDAE|nr:MULTISPECIES: bifunctional nuclease family protein [unclassified Cryobacterium]TFD07094.1 bifunctional nuclease family protein [Cryobacterium sp. TMT1-66-1]TFD13399.1 bifunctional nuclease family protein [Cryobacterium sp. TMT1-2-2]
MVEVRVLGVAIDSEGQHIILLKPVGEPQAVGTVLAIVVGEAEATSTLIALSGEEPPRPLSHDLMKTLIDTVGAHFERVDVTRIDQGIFYAEITLRIATGSFVLDARPSDSVALALRAGAPIFVAEDVLQAEGIPAAMVESGRNVEEAPVREQSLDEFKDFLEHVDPEDFQS